jgi:hypothetical protein
MPGTGLYRRSSGTGNRRAPIDGKRDRQRALKLWSWPLSVDTDITMALSNTAPQGVLFGRRLIWSVGFVPEAVPQLIGSESDSAALAPLQVDSRPVVLPYPSLSPAVATGAVAGGGEGTGRRVTLD